MSHRMAVASKLLCNGAAHVVGAWPSHESLWGSEGSLGQVGAETQSLVRHGAVQGQGTMHPCVSNLSGPHGSSGCSEEQLWAEEESREQGL